MKNLSDVKNSMSASDIPKPSIRAAVITNPTVDPTKAIMLFNTRNPRDVPFMRLGKKNAVLNSHLPFILSLLSVITAASQNAIIHSGIVCAIQNVNVFLNAEANVLVANRSLKFLYQGRPFDTNSCGSLITTVCFRSQKA